MCYCNCVVGVINIAVLMFTARTLSREGKGGDFFDSLLFFVGVPIRFIRVVRSERGEGCLELCGRRV